MQNNSNHDQVLVINCGSSSVKFSLIEPSSGDTLLSALAERLNSAQAVIKIKPLYQQNSSKIELALTAPHDHKTAIDALVEHLQSNKLIDNIKIIGHRVVHGGEKYSQPTLINHQVLEAIEQLSKLAPLHNPANLIGIKAAQHTFKTLPQVAIFDTAFHQTMPEKAYLYGIPYELYQDHSIRRYGFHGTSHFFVAQAAAQTLNKPLKQCNFISAHLGNGCSVTAIKEGNSIDTSLGFTPLEGVMMGTRSGDIDPGVIFYLVEQLGYSIEQVNKLLNKESGLQGVSGISNDCRELEQAMDNNNKRAILALNIFCYRIAKSIASFSSGFEQLDGLIFTGGIGENSMFVREQVLKQLSLLNFKLDPQKNEATRFGQSGLISTTDSRACWVIPTNEEWVIAEQSQTLINQLSTASTKG
jgi:acetate kinase